MKRVLFSARPGGAARGQIFFASAEYWRLTLRGHGANVHTQTPVERRKTIRARWKSMYIRYISTYRSFSCTPWPFVYLYCSICSFVCWCFFSDISKSYQHILMRFIIFHKILVVTRITWQSYPPSWGRFTFFKCFAHRSNYSWWKRK